MNMQYEIEKDVPMPAPEQRPSGVYPFRGMKVGDSFEVPLSKQAKLSSAVSTLRKRSWAKDRKWSIIRGENTYRCWRTK